MTSSQTLGVGDIASNFTIPYCENGEGYFKTSGIEDKQMIAMNIAHLNQDRSHRLLFKIIEENIERWWS